MQSTVIVLTLGLLAAFANAQKVCVKTTPECEPTAMAAKQLVTEMRAIQITDSVDNLKLYLSKLQLLFNQTASNKCPVDICGCKDGQLMCDRLANRLRARVAAQEPKLPACMADSEKAKAVHAQLKEAHAAGNRDAVVEILMTTLAKISEKLDTRTDAENEKLVACITTTLTGLRNKIQEKVSKLNFQQNCDFCATGVDNPVPRLIPVPVLLHNAPPHPLPRL